MSEEDLKTNEVDVGSKVLKKQLSKRQLQLIICLPDESEKSPWNCENLISVTTLF